MTITVWCGPAPAMVPVWPGSQVRNILCSEVSRPTCAELAGSFEDAVGGAAPVYLAALAPSGGRLVDAWITSPKVQGVFLADALDPAAPPLAGAPAPDQRLTDWIVKAASNPSFRAVVATSEPGLATRIEAIAASAQARGVKWALRPAAPQSVRVGAHDVLTPARAALDFGAGEIAATRMWSSGGACLLDLGDRVAPELLAWRLWPLFTGRSDKAAPPIEAPRRRPRGMLIGAGVLGAAALAGLVAWAFSASKGRVDR